MDVQVIHVLLIENNPGDAGLVKEHLAGAGQAAIFHLAHVDALKTGLELLSEKHVDIILLDLNLPDSQGLATFEKLYSQAHYLPIILLAGIEDDELAARALGLGAQDYLIKTSLDARQLTRAICQATQRAQAESNFSGGEALLRAAFENAISGVVLLSTDGILTHANPVLYQMLGYTPAELEGQHIDAITHALDLRFTSSMFRRALTGELKKLNFENRFLHKDGQIIWAQVSGSLLEIGGRTRYFVVYIRDITEPLLAATRLRQSEEKYRSLFENIPDGVYRTTPAGVLLTANPALVRMLGFESEDELKQTSVYDLYFDPQDRDDFLNLAQRDGDVHNREVRMRRRDGRELYVLNNARAFCDKNGVIQFIEGTLSDITARKQAEAIQRLLEEKFSKAFHTSPDAISINRLKDGLYIDINQGFTSVFGYQASDVLGKPDETLGLWINSSEREHFLQVLNEHGDVNNLEVLMCAREGGLRSCLVSARLLEINSEMCVLAIIRDVTERKRAADALAESNRRFSDTLENIRLAAVILNLDGQITFCNDYLLALTGWRRDEIMGANWFDLFASDPEAEREFARFMHLGVIPSHIENSITTSVGDKLWISWNNTPLRELDGRVTGMASIGEDITARARMEAALRESEQRYRNIYENATVGMYRTTPDGRILMCNPALIRMLGYDSFEELAAYNLEQEPSFIGYPRAEFRQLIESAGVITGLESAWKRKDGSTIYVCESAKLIYGPGGNSLYYEGTIEDITGRKQAEAALQKQLERLNALRTIDETIIGSLDLKVTLNVLLEQIISQLKVDACKILLYSEQSRLLRYGASKGFRTEATNQATQRSGETFSSRVARERVSLLIPDISKEPGSIFQGPALVGEDFVTYLGVPLIAKAQVKGVLEIFMRSAFEPNAEWTGLLEMMSGLAAISIDNAALFEGLQRSNFDLAMAYDTTLEGWSHALDLRDKETEGHSRRVAELTIRMAQAYGFSDRELVQVRRGALLHDIGKMGLPDSILLKPGVLSLNEWAIMRKHPVYAYELLSPIKYLQPALEIPYCHHERWDGSGYPRGLKETQIPLAARMFAIVDVYDALTSNRPYRAAWSEEKTYAYIRSLSGHQFDPQMVELFFKVIS